MPVWLKPTRESFWETTMLLGSAGFSRTHSSAWRRKSHIWLARTLSGIPGAVKTFGQPLLVGVMGGTMSGDCVCP
jgi:hypothetical protein